MESVRAKKYGYQVPYAESIRREAGVMTMAVGHIVHADQAEAILREGRADLTALAREIMYNPNWPMDAAQKLGADPDFKLVPPHPIPTGSASAPSPPSRASRRRGERGSANRARRRVDRSPLPHREVLHLFGALGGFGQQEKPISVPVDT